MKWIFALFFLFSIHVYAVDSKPAKSSTNFTGNCPYLNQVMMASACHNSLVTYLNNQYPNSAPFTKGSLTVGSTSATMVFVNKFGTSSSESMTGSNVTTYTCPPDGYPSYNSGPTLVNGVQVCSKIPKTCMMGAVVRIASNGDETCVPNCSSAAGLTHSSQYFFQAGPTAGSTAGEITCYGQCSIKTVGGGVQLSSGAWTGNFTFTGANCPVIRPEPTVDSESNTSSNGSATPVDESITSPGTTDALGQLTGAASAATGTPVQPTVTGPDGTATLKDVTKTIADSANAQIKATSAQNVATGNLISSTNKDLQNTIIKTIGGGGAAAALQAQGNGKLDGIGSAIGAGNGKLDGIQSTLNDISDKLDEPGEETPFVPGAGSGAFWESVLPESSFTEIKAKQDESIQEMKDLSTQFQDSITFTNLSASGAPEEWSLNMHGTALPFGMGAFQMIIDMGLAAVILLLCALYAIYIITNRK